MKANDDDKHSSDMKNERLKVLEKVSKNELTPQQADSKLLGLSGVVESFCSECGVPCYYDMCNDCSDDIARLDADCDYDDDEPDYSDFDCSCGAWQWSEKAGKPIHVADCICGSSEPWG